MNSRIRRQIKQRIQRAQRAQAAERRSFDSNPDVMQFYQRLQDIQTPEPRLTREQRRTRFENRRLLEERQRQLQQMIQINQRGEANPKLDLLKRRFKLTGTIPEEFKCPITLEIMEDPVILSDGQTFERAAIIIFGYFLNNFDIFIIR